MRVLSFALAAVSIARKDVVELEYLDCERSKYQAMGLPDTMLKIGASERLNGI